jgi:fructose-1,6-bisphosphatase I
MINPESLVSPIGITLGRFIKNYEANYENASGALSQLLRDISLAAKIINRDVNRAGLIDIIGGTENDNIQGEAQQKLDLIANIRFQKALKYGGEVCALVTEEDDGIIETGNTFGKYVIAIDPLDGSSNIDVNVSIGTIFSIYRRVSELGKPATIADFLQGGRKQIAAGYIIYGSSAILVYTAGNGVNGFTYKSSIGEFILSHKNINHPANGDVFSVNFGNYNEFNTSEQTFIQNCILRKYSNRYIGSLVADYHRNSLKGGIYLYPATEKNKNGKLRILYECFPLAFLAEQSSAMATDGSQNILDIVPLELHQRSPFFIGSEKMMGEFMDK